MNKKNRNTNRKKSIRQIEKLTKDQTESLAQKPIEVAREVFENLAEWRNRSLSSNIRM